MEIIYTIKKMCLSRALGAVGLEDLKKYSKKKTGFLKKEYSRIHANIISHPERSAPENLSLLDQFSFVFISIDKSEVKKLIITYLESKKHKFY
jgi:hypothetical protein